MPSAAGGARGGQARDRRRRAAHPGRLRGLRRGDARAGRAGRRHRAHQRAHARGLRARRARARRARRAPAARLRPRPAGARRTSRRMRAVRPIEHVDMVGRDADGVDALVAAADIVCCATTAREPLFDGALVRRPRDGRRDRLARAGRPRGRRRARRAGRRSSSSRALGAARGGRRDRGDRRRGAGARTSSSRSRSSSAARRFGSARPAAVQEHRDGLGGRGGGVGARPLTRGALRSAYGITEGREFPASRRRRYRERAASTREDFVGYRPTNSPLVARTSANATGAPPAPRSLPSPR